MVCSNRKVEPLDVSSKLNVLKKKKVSDNAASRQRKLFEEVSFSPLCCLRACFSTITDKAL